MTNIIGKKKCLVFDYGSYVAVAQRLAEPDGFGAVYYYVPKVYNGFPDHRPYDIGRNVENITVVDEWAEVIHDVDIVVFCDAHEPALQEYFVSIGKRVFGSKYACKLETDRKFLKETIASVGLPVNEYEVAYGLDALEGILQQRENVYVKSSLRGDMETWHHENWILSKGEIQRMRKNLGVYANRETYIVESPIESLAEIGIDSFVINGEVPELVLTGIELKDTGYVGKIVPYDTLPKQLKLVSEKLAPIFSSMEYRGAHSNEVIVSGDKKGYLLDLTNRQPNPPTDLYLKLYTNFPQMVWDVAGSFIPKIEYEYPWGVQFIIKSDLATTEPSPIIVPDAYRDNVKLKNCTIAEDGAWYYTPLGIEMKEIGSVIGWGKTMKQAVKMAQEAAEAIKGFDIKINTDCIGLAEEQLERLEKAGIRLF